MMKLRLSSLAARDLLAIQDFGLQEFGSSATRKHMAGFERVFTLLRQHPRSGPRRPEYGDEIRAFSYSPHRILYLIGPDELLVVRVIHSSRRVTDLGNLH